MRSDLDRTLKILATIILAAVIGYVVWQILLQVLYPIMLFLMGAIVAFVLSPLVKRLHQAGVPKPLAILLVYIGVLAVASLLGYLLINPLVNQIQEAATSLPQKVKSLQLSVNNLLSQLNRWLTGHGFQSLSDLQTNAASTLTDVGNSAVKDWLPAIVQTSVSFLVDLVLTLVIAFYLLLDGERLKERLYNFVPDSQLSRVVFVEATINEVLGGYLRGQLLMSLTIGTMAGVGTWLLGVPYPAVIGVLSGILELVPMLGPWLSSMPAMAIALVSGNPWPLALWVAVYFVIIQQLESNVIGPRITGHAVGVHPLAALMALLVGIELDGIIGALFAVPVAGILYVIGMAIYYDFAGRPRPQPVLKQPKPTWVTGLAGHIGSLNIRYPAGKQATAGLGLVGFVRATLRRIAVGDAPDRLADVEHARDALLRPMLDQRQRAQEQAETLDPEQEREPEPEGARRRDASDHSRPDRELSAPRQSA
jgi:predicted PurR-regulated permease PerM